MKREEAITNLRDTLQWLKEEGEEVEVLKPEIDPVLEITAFARAFDDGPAFLFENLKGYPNARMKSNLYAKPERLAKMVGVDDAKKIKFKIWDAFRNNKVIGKVASVTDCRQPYVYNVNILGSEGAIKNDKFYTKKIDGLNGWCDLDVDLMDSGDVSNHPYDEQFSHFAECLDQGIDPNNNLASAFESHRVIFAADRSNETGKPVRLDEFSR